MCDAAGSSAWRAGLGDDLLLANETVDPVRLKAWRRSGLPVTMRSTRLRSTPP
jgi:hypothetical protein